MYTTDNWVTKQVFNTWQATDAGGDMTLNNVRADFSQVTGVANNANFGFGFTAAYGTGQTAYESAWSGIDLSSFKYSFDMIQVYSGTSDIVQPRTRSSTHGPRARQPCGTRLRPLRPGWLRHSPTIPLACRLDR